MSYEQDMKELRKVWNNWAIRKDEINSILAEEIFGFIKLGYIKGQKVTNDEWYDWIEERLNNGDKK